MPITQEGLSLYVQANIGYQGKQPLRFSMDAQNVWTQNFNLSNYVDVPAEKVKERNGNYIEAKTYSAINTCLVTTSKNQVDMCSWPKGSLQVVTSAEWNYAPIGSHGLIGLASGSPIWEGFPSI